MHVHHLNCGCMCPVGGRLFDGFSRGLQARLVCHCLLIETDRGLVLIDTGFGVQDIQSPYSRLSPFFVRFNNIQFDRQYTAIAQARCVCFAVTMRLNSKHLLEKTMPLNPVCKSH